MRGSAPEERGAPIAGHGGGVCVLPRRGGEPRHPASPCHLGLSSTAGGPPQPPRLCADSGRARRGHILPRGGRWSRRGICQGTCASGVPDLGPRRPAGRNPPGPRVTSGILSAPWASAGAWVSRSCGARSPSSLAGRGGTGVATPGGLSFPQDGRGQIGGGGPARGGAFSPRPAGTAAEQGWRSLGGSFLSHAMGGRKRSAPGRSGLVSSLAGGCGCPYASGDPPAFLLGRGRPRRAGRT